MVNNLKLVSCIVASEDDILNVETCRDCDEFKQISRTCAVIDCTVIIQLFFNTNWIALFQVLQIWQHLCQEKSIPLSRQGRVLKLVVGRLHDKSCNVKKNAMHLVTAFLEGNPFAAKVCCTTSFWKPCYE